MRYRSATDKTVGAGERLRRAQSICATGLTSKNPGAAAERVYRRREHECAHEVAGSVHQNARENRRDKTRGVADAILDTAPSNRGVHAGQRLRDRIDVRRNQAERGAGQHEQQHRGSRTGHGAAGDTDR